MRFVVRQKVFSLGDNFIIKDEFGNDRYIVRGKVLTLGDKLKIYDTLGNEIVYIEQKLFRLLPEYDIYLYGRYAARVKKEFRLFSHRLNIDSSMGRYTVDGNFLGYDFTIRKNNMPSAYVSKKFFSWSDTYGVDIMEGENEAFILALVIVIDQIIHDDENRNK